MNSELLQVLDDPDNLRHLGDEEALVGNVPGKVHGNGLGNNFAFPVALVPCPLGQHLLYRMGEQNVVLPGFPLGKDSRQVFEAQGRFPGREQIRADEKAHEVPGGYIKPVLEGVEFFPISGLETEHHALGFAGIGGRQKLLEISNFTFTKFMIKKRDGTGNITGSAEPV
ncbi:MAG: hypothetical protein LBJ35_03355 [Spirochaetaceae bacterium]|nr:hypothetical protein [Spirochaetaceae bacterium]